ncbi:MAG: ammonia permease, partial [Lentisphaerota bacterium]
LVVVAVLFFDRIRIDDPVGALSVHLVNGVFGTIAVGLFASDAVMPNTTGNGLFYGGGVKLLLAQLSGVGAVAVFTFLVAIAVWLVIKVIAGLRVSRSEEVQGLDVGEHGMEAYPDFQGFLTK